MGGDVVEIRGKDCQRTCIKDTWIKLKVGRIEGGRWGWLGWEEWWGENGDNHT